MRFELYVPRFNIGESSLQTVMGVYQQHIAINILRFEIQQEHFSICLLSYSIRKDNLLLKINSYSLCQVNPFYK